MERFIHRENVNNYLDQLRREVDPVTRSTLRTLLVEEMKKFANSSENLDLADRHLSDCKLRILRQHRIIDDLRQESRSMAEAEQLLDNLIDIEALLTGVRSDTVSGLSRHKD